jgi:hypothetical protein
LIQKNEEYLTYLVDMDQSASRCDNHFEFLKENNQPIALGSASKMLGHSKKLETLAILTPLLAMMLQMQNQTLRFFLIV